MIYPVKSVMRIIHVTYTSLNHLIVVINATVALI